MLYTLTYLTLLTTLATAVGMLLRITYPTCQHRRCAEHSA